MLKLTFAIIWAGFFSFSAAHALEAMDDEALAGVAGQSLFTSNYATNGSFGYYRLGLDAEFNLNANISRLALGCDGAGGTGLCDIDLSNVRFAGVNASDSSDSGPGTDFLLRRPYIEFAIKNPDNPATRELSGFRIGAYEALGSLSIGENPNTSDINDDTGISRFTGFMVATLTNAQLTNVGVTSFGICCLIGPTTATVASHTQAMTLRRDNTTTISNIKGVAIGLTLNNIWINNQPLDTIHKVVVANDFAGTVPTKDFYLSNQKETLQWQTISTGAFGGTVNQTVQGNTQSVAIPSAEKGWWMYLPQVQLPNVTSNQSVRVGTLSVIGGLFGGQVDISPIDLQMKPADNCWGSSAFC